MSDPTQDDSDSGLRPGMVRIRRKYMPPTKDRGWQCEHSLEGIYPEDNIPWERIAIEDNRAYRETELECVRRDAAEGRVRRHFA